jgi:sulfite exporter TauE/SafE
MEEKTLGALITLACFMGFAHTILGPDHYLPFIMISWSRKWSPVRTSAVTFLCGLGHVLSSTIIGLIGVVLGFTVEKLSSVEAARGDLAGWLLIAFGLAYFIWGIRQIILKKQHTHKHIHLSDYGHQHHEHPHTHENEHKHWHLNGAKNVTPWVLFIIFVFGPCEVLIPMLMVPACKKSVFGMILVILAFAVCTIGTMLAAVFVGRAGFNFLKFKKLSKYAHLLSGAAILMCGISIKFLGL